MSVAPANLLLAYYADDFTGATDALEQLETAGVRAALFLEPPSTETLAARPELRAIGVAGCTRALATDEIGAEVRPALEQLKALGPRHVHYKVCSTFDSSPKVGSIGRVIDVAADVFDSKFVPVVVGSPALGRWCVFGNLFAGVGIGAESAVYRLDRHPSMSQHPTTPADEADLRLHLGRQTDKPIGLVDLRSLEDPGAAAAALEKELAAGAEVVLFDSLAPAHLRTVGELLDTHATADRTLFSAGSSAIETALSSHWRAAGVAERTAPMTAQSDLGRLLVLAGSCSPVTAEQVDRAVEAGYAGVPLDPARLGEVATIDTATERVVAAFAEDRPVIVSTNLNNGSSGAKLAPELLGEAFGRIARAAAERAGLRMLVVAGGDTSSYTARALGVESLEYLAPLTTGAPLCRAASSDPSVDGLRVVFKGGQVGRPDFLRSLVTTQATA
ncbi:hypothetical protein Mal64_14470 [Pseudobythopirellula maris]|uniref:Four-carbon acid sugar kinase family protein n=1 Tax=Pseudobythopirellula maris TaxID=2527991 RepID=A0A5C5ZVH1_9BACT|nr:four-carbon acid sugar kinase family protein [Pseudobythopirellula maris]TWT91048.1 hypothetical protein Mal64_14470 [Pseudobythopirellula maris]